MMGLFPVLSTPSVQTLANSWGVHKLRLLSNERRTPSPNNSFGDSEKRYEQIVPYAPSKVHLASPVRQSYFLFSQTSCGLGAANRYSPPWIAS